MKRVPVLMITSLLLTSISVSPLLATDPLPGRMITVTGNAEVRVVPDEVILTFGVETSALNLSAAKTENDDRTAKILAVAKEHGIKSKHIQTDHLSIEPRYHNRHEARDFLGYFVRKTIVVTLKDIEQFESLLSATLQAGANYVHGIQFRTTKMRRHRDEARNLALKAAGEKALAMATALHQTVGRPHTIREGHAGWWSGYNASWGSRWHGAMAQNVMQNAGNASSGLEDAVAPGQLSVTAQVTVSFELQD